MKPIKKLRSIATLSVLVGAGLLTSSTVPATGAVTITAVEIDGDVVFTGSGTVDLTAWSFDYAENRSVARSLDPDGWVSFGGTVAYDDVYTEPEIFGGPTSLGPIGPARADHTSGDLFLLWWDRQTLAVPGGYTSGSPLSGSATFADATIESLGLTPGTYEWTWGTRAAGYTDSLQLVIIPEPTTFALLGLGSLALLLAKRRK